MNENTTPLRLIAKLIAYFLVLSVIISVLILNRPELLGFLPVGGTDVNESSTPADRDGEITESRLAQVAGEDSYFGGGQPSIDSVWRMVIFLVLSLASTILVMLPITWTYLATQYDSGPSKAFVRALIILPICACTVVLLIQDSLALAFGLAALVAAVRFRVTLREAIDGIYIFAAICVGLGAGIGHIGIAVIMAMFFCLANAMLWYLDYGRNPVEDARVSAKEAKRNKT